jgi:hypothetical protein
MVRTIHRCLLSTALVLMTSAPALACPMCKLALESDDPTPRAYMYSILFMMGTIGSIFAGMIGFLFWMSRLERANMDAAGYQHLFENAVSQKTANPTA